MDNIIKFFCVAIIYFNNYQQPAIYVSSVPTYTHPYSVNIFIVLCGKTYIKWNAQILSVQF